jgi:hypothetical protein
MIDSISLGSGVRIQGCAFRVTCSEVRGTDYSISKLAFPQDRPRTRTRRLCTSLDFEDEDNDEDHLSTLSMAGLCSLSNHFRNFTKVLPLDNLLKLPYTSYEASSLKRKVGSATVPTVSVVHDVPNPAGAVARPTK